MSQADEDPTFFERERDRLARDITSVEQGFEELLSSTNVLNRKLEEVLGMTKEYDTIAELWQSFYRLMRGPIADDSGEEKTTGLPGTGGHVVAMKQSKGPGTQ
ncbi:DASH complex subunit DAD1 [Termitomyces sp. J132]|nr:DASH complex subunit DAD1 [Termitomyces sp. J132]